MAAELHRQVVDARLAARIGERVAAIAGVVDAVAGTELVLHAIEREPERAALHREVLARARRVRGELAGVHARRNGRPHQLELHARQHGGEDPPLPARRIVGRVVLAAAQHDHARRTLVPEQPGDAGVEPGRDAIEYQDRRHLAPPLDLREHAAAHAGARLELVEREAPALPLEAQARPETGHVEPGGERGRTTAARIHHSEHHTLWWKRARASRQKNRGASSLPCSRSVTVAAVYRPEVPTQPVSETSTVTPSGAVYFTSTLPVRCPYWPTPSALLMSSRGSEPAFFSRSVIASRLSTWKP